jgi:sec-independent protein translocase protein TatA
MTSALLTPTHLALVLVIMLLLFGAKRLPESGRALGRAMREFREAITGRDDASAATRSPGLTAGGQPESTNVDHD